MAAPSETFSHLIAVTKVSAGVYTVNNATGTTDYAVTVQDYTDPGAPGDNLTQLGDIQNDHFTVSVPSNGGFGTGIYKGNTGHGGFVGYYTGGKFTKGYFAYSDSNYATGQTIDTTNAPFATLCFASGTLIRTERGDVAVEELTVGSVVVTASGAHRPIKWLGHRGYIGRFANSNPEVLPICFKAGSLAEGVPARDLRVSLNHAMFFDGVLIPAKCLVNGGRPSVTQDREVESIEYWHVELDSHDVLIAEGAAAESFVGDGGRNIFHNVHEFYTRYPEAIDGEAVYCYPRVESGYTLDAVRCRINALAGLPVVAPLAYGELRGEFTCDGITVTGWAQNGAFPDAPVCLDILVDGILVKRAYAGLFDADHGHHAFRAMLPEPITGSGSITVRRSTDGAILDAERLAARAA